MPTLAILAHTSGQLANVSCWDTASSTYCAVTVAIVDSHVVVCLVKRLHAHKKQHNNDFKQVSVQPTWVQYSRPHKQQSVVSQCSPPRTDRRSTGRFRCDSRKFLDLHSPRDTGSQGRLCTCCFWLSRCGSLFQLPVFEGCQRMGNDLQFDNSHENNHEMASTENNGAQLTHGTVRSKPLRLLRLSSAQAHWPGRVAHAAVNLVLIPRRRLLTKSKPKM